MVKPWFQLHVDTSWASFCDRFILPKDYGQIEWAQLRGAEVDESVSHVSRCFRADGDLHMAPCDTGLGASIYM